MRKLKITHKLHKADYCAFLGKYKKPTHIWTNVLWESKGTTGKGLCCQRCLALE